MAIAIRMLGAPDADAFVALRAAALEAEPFAFLASPEDDLVQSANEARAHFSAMNDGRLR